MQDSIKSLSLRNTLLCNIKKMYPIVGMATLSKYGREFLAGAQASIGGRSSKVSTATQQYIAKMVRNGSLNGPRGVQKHIRSISISMSFSGAEKLLNGLDLKTKRKNKTNFVSAANKKLRLAISVGPQAQAADSI
jgi:hypothetical protein